MASWRRNHEAEALVGVLREISDGSDSLLARYVRLEVLADRPMPAATKSKAGIFLNVGTAAERDAEIP